MINVFFCSIVSINLILYFLIILKKKFYFNIIIFLELCTWYGCIYYFYIGTSYGAFENHIILFCSILWMISTFSLYLFSKISFTFKIKIPQPKIVSLKFISYITITILTIWILLFYKYLPLYQVFTGNVIYRLDTYETNVKGYYTYYTVIIFILSYLLFVKFFNLGFKRVPLFFLFLFILLGIAGGNKSCVAYVTFFIIITLLTKRFFKFKTLLASFTFFSLILSLYFFLKGSNYANILELLNSAARRLFLTQSASLFHRIELSYDNILFIDYRYLDLRDIAKSVYNKIFYMYGTMPSPIWGDMILQFGIFGIFISLFFQWISYILILFSISVKRLDLVIIPIMLLWLLQQAGINDAQALRYSFGLIFYIFCVFFVIPPKIITHK